MKNLNKFFKYWHILIHILNWLVFFGVCYGSYILVSDFKFQLYNILLIDLTVLAFTIAVSCSHAYNCVPDPEKSYLWNQAEKKRSIWLHACHCWRTISIWMTITPLYCTCIAIYLSAYAMSNEHILIYSILSLVISLGVYVISPSSRALAYRKAYNLVVNALSDYELNAEKDEQKLAKAIKKGTKVIAKVEKKDTE